MKTPQVPAMPGMTPLGIAANRVVNRLAANPILPIALRHKAEDEKTMAQRKWRSGLKPNAEQKPCDHGLFGDEHLQRELFNRGSQWHATE